MSVLPIESEVLPDEVESPVEPTTAVLVTQQQVMFSTAAATPLPRGKAAGRWIAALRAVFATSTVEARPVKRKHYPRRRGFLEHATMARAMDRL